MRNRLPVATACVSVILMWSTGAVAQNQVPVATNDTVTTAQGTSVLIDVLANDSDRDGDLLTVTVASNGLPSPAALKNHGDGSFTYSASSQHPLGDFTFDYLLSDGRAGHDRRATVTVRVEAGTAPPTPIAVDDELATEEGQPIGDLFARLVANDLPDPSALSIGSYTQPEQGSVSAGSGEGIYTPPLSFVGIDTFAYTVRDGTGQESGSATVTITITAANQAPVTADDRLTTEQDTTLFIAYAALLANDFDPEGDPIEVCRFSQPGQGTVLPAWPGDGLEYSPSPGFVGDDAFTYAACDSSGAESGEATVTITVTRANSPPVAVDDQLIAEQDTPLQFPHSALLGNDSDPDGDPFHLYGTSQPQHGELDFCWPLCTYTPSPGYFGTDSFQYTLQDSLGAVSPLPATVTVTVRARLEASFTASCSGLDCTFDASGSVAPADASFAWSFGDGTGGTGTVATHRYSSGGTYTVTLDLGHVTGSEASTSATVDVVDPAVVLLLILD